MKRLLVKVYGRVQGVGFRYFTLSKAELLDIKGFVKNMPDGSVFVDCEGDEDSLKIFLDCLKKGPSFAYVERLEIEAVSPKNYREFVIKR